MSNKVELEIVAAAMKENEVEPAKMRKVLETLQQEIAAQEQGGEEKPPPVKKQWGILVSDPEKTMPTADLVGWVFQVPENENPTTIRSRINETAYDFNATKKGRLLPVKTVGEALENIPAKAFKERDVWVKNKIPVLVVTTDNQIPRETKE